MNCATCEYYIEQKQMIVGKKVGDCRRYPPTAQILGNGQIVSVFPPTQDIGRCGEYKPAILN